MPPKAVVTGHCYCGQGTIEGFTAPKTVTYCHCSDCRRLTGAPVAAFAAFSDADISVTAPEAPEVTSGVRRWFCPRCGSQMAARYGYLPGQTYVPLGILDQAADWPPEQHSHAASALPWLHISDDLPRFETSVRDRLNASS